MSISRLFSDNAAFKRHAHDDPNPKKMLELSSFLFVSKYRWNWQFLIDIIEFFVGISIYFWNDTFLASQIAVKSLVLNSAYIFRYFLY